MFWFQEEILNSIIIPVKIQSQQEDNHDPLETCDITPAYRHLNLKNETKTLETLNKAVVCWTSALENVRLILCWLQGNQVVKDYVDTVADTTDQRVWLPLTLVCVGGILPPQPGCLLPKHHNMCPIHNKQSTVKHGTDGQQACNRLQKLYEKIEIYCSVH